MKKTVIIGAGPAGLSAAYYLEQRGCKNYILFERNSYPGGLAASFKTKKGFTFDFGGHVAFSNSDYFNKVYGELLKGKFLTHPRSAWIYLDKNYIAYPFQNNIFQLPEKKAEECLEGVKSALRAKGKKIGNFKEWIYEVFGNGIAKYFLLPYNQKIWAYPLEDMSYQWISERVATVNYKDIAKRYREKKIEKNWGPNNQFKYPARGGTGEFFNKLYEKTDKSKIKLNNEAVKIDLKNKEILLKNGNKIKYDNLINTIPLNEFLKKCVNIDGKIKKLEKEFLSTGVISIGIGVKGKLPVGKTWVYFPDKNIPFYRLTYFSGYSPNLVPSKKYFSVLCEVSYSKHKKENVKDAVKNTLRALIDLELAGKIKKKDIFDIWFRKEDYAYPVPFLGRDEILNKVVPYLKEKDVYTCGRFGLWKYEIGNMDHCFMQGIEAAQEIMKRQPQRAQRIFVKW